MKKQTKPPTSSPGPSLKDYPPSRKYKCLQKMMTDIFNLSKKPAVKALAKQSLDRIESLEKTEVVDKKWRKK